MHTTNRRRGLLVVVPFVVGSLTSSLACGGADDNVNVASPRTDSGLPDISQGADGPFIGDTTTPDAASCESDFVVSGTCTQPAPAIACSGGFCAIPAGCFVMGSPSCEPGRGAYSEDEVQVTLTRDFLLEQFETSQGDWAAAGFANPSRVDRDGSPSPLEKCPVEMNLEMNGWYCHNAQDHTHPRGQLTPNAWGLFDMLGNQFEWVHDRFNGLGYGAGPLIDPHGSWSSTARSTHE